MAAHFHAHYGSLLAYTHQATAQMIATLQAQPSAHAHPDAQEALRLLAHSLNAHERWLARIEGREARYGIWEEHPLQNLAPMNDDLYAQAKDYLLATDDFGQAVSYENSQGQPFTNTLEDIFTHLFNHYTHHRAQAATLFRRAGVTPPATDYIFYKRREAAEG